jgi:gluconokinase
VTRVLALDVGSSSVRAQVFDERGTAVSEEPAKREYEGESDPNRIVELTRAALDEALADGPDVAAVSGSCFGHSLLALDAGGEPMTPILGWRDRRSAEAAEMLLRRLDPEAVPARTGCPLHTSFWPAKLLWLAETQPEVFRSARRFVSFAEYLYALLVEPDPPLSLAMASGTGLLNLAAGDWDEELLNAVGVGPERLPRVSDEALGGGPPWYPAVLDGVCSNLGAGCVTHERAALMIGTSGALRIMYETDEPRPRPGLFMYRLDERRVVEGGSLSDGGNLYRWLDDTLQPAAGSLTDRTPDEHGLTFVTLLGGERSPGWHLHASGAVAGLSFDTTPRDLRQAALEGVAFRFAEIVELLPEVEQIVATGGGLLSDPDWLQLTADALGRSLTVSGVDEASLRGAAVLALERLGLAADEAPVGSTYEPRPELADAYRAARERQRRLYDAVT